jgi:hypothetical protein
MARMKEKLFLGVAKLHMAQFGVTRFYQILPVPYVRSVLNIFEILLNAPDNRPDNPPFFISGIRPETG